MSQKIKTRVLLAMPDLAGLGVQHVVLCLLKFWNKEDFDVKLLLHSRKGEFQNQFPDDFQSINIDDYILNIPKIRILSRFFGYKKAIENYKPNVVISFVPYSNYGCMFAKLFSKHKFGLIVSEHAHVTTALNDFQEMNNIFMKFYRKTFQYFYNHIPDAIKCISSESMDDLVTNHKIIKNKVMLINDPIDFKFISSASLEPVEHPWFTHEEIKNRPILINVGRLAIQKNHERLLKTFKLVIQTYPSLRLVIVGDGTLKKDLIEITEQLGLTDSVVFLGYQNNPWKYILHSRLFILSSNWEGLPCVISEAMSLKVPVVSVNCPSGPTEMLDNGRLGFLTNEQSIAALTDQIITALTDKDLCNKKIDAAFQSIHKYEPEFITRIYENACIKYAIH